MTRTVTLLTALACAAPALTGNRYQEQVEFYTKKLRGGDWKSRVKALEGLGRIGAIKASYTEAAVPAVVKLLNDGDARVRAAAAAALGKLDPDPKVALAPLQKLLKDANYQVQAAAGRGLAAMGPAAKPALGDIREAARKAREYYNEDRMKNRRAQRAMQVLRDATRAINGSWR